MKMKKMLLSLAALGLTITSSLTVVACQTKLQAEKIDPQKLMVLQAVQEIVDEGITYHDKFLINYQIQADEELEDERQSFNMDFLFRENRKDLVSLFSRMLTTLILEKLALKIDFEQLKELFPSFNLNVFFTDNPTESDDSRRNILTNKEALLPYIILINFDSFEKNQKFKYFFQSWKPEEKRIEEWSKLNNWTSDKNFLHSPTFGYGEYLIIKNQKTKELPVFNFKQTKYIEDKKEKLDLYFNFFINTSFGKLFNDDPDIATFSFFEPFDWHLGLPQNQSIPKNIVSLLKKGFVEQHNQEVIQFIKTVFKARNTSFGWGGNNLFNFLSDVKINQIKFVKAYEKEEILKDQNLLYAFGDPNVGRLNLRPSEGILVYDLDYQLVNGEVETTNSHQERIYISVNN